MDPYLERHWRDVHADLVALSRTALNQLLPADLVARMEERVVIDNVNYEKSRAIHPDVHVYEDARRRTTPASQHPGKTIVAEPIMLEPDAEEHTETYITVLDTDGEKLVTVIEFLSPTNKLPGDGREQYRTKRDELVAARVNLVEINLVRQGAWRELLSPIVAPANVNSAYRATIRRFYPLRRIEFYPFSLRQPLPGLSIPLRDGDEDVVLDLQSLFDQAYYNGRYDRNRLLHPCRPPLEGEDAGWAQVLLLEAGLRRDS